MELVADDFLARLKSYVRRRVPSSADAEDVVQTVLLRLLEARGARPPASPHAWLLAAARRAIVDLHRARARDGTEPTQALDEPSIPEAEDLSDAAACLAPLLAGLPEDERRLLVRVDVEGASQAALARELGLSASGMKSRVQRARTRLREALLARCRVERDVHGLPLGDATCRDAATSRDCGCAAG